MVSNGPNSSIPAGSDINIVNNLYSTVDLSQKHQRRISSDGTLPDNHFVSLHGWRRFRKLLSLRDV